MYLKLIEGPTEVPVDLPAARAHVREPLTANDAQIQFALDAAIAHVDGKDGVLGRALCPQTWELVLDAFPCRRMEIPLPPLQSVTWIKYIDTAGVEQTLSDSSYWVGTAAEPAIIQACYSWPATQCRPEAVRIRFVAGYADTDAVPSPIKSAILLLMGDLYENREASIIGTIQTDNPAVDRLLFPYRVNLIA